jgi:L-fuconolactonase
MYGSDWPVCVLAASYERVFDLANGFAIEWSPSERDAFFGTTAAEFYGLSG